MLSSTTPGAGAEDEDKGTTGAMPSRIGDGFTGKTFPVLLDWHGVDMNWSTFTSPLLPQSASIISASLGTSQGTGCPMALLSLMGYLGIVSRDRRCCLIERARREWEELGKALGALLKAGDVHKARFILPHLLQTLGSLEEALLLSLTPGLCP